MLLTKYSLVCLELILCSRAECLSYLDRPDAFLYQKYFGLLKQQLQRLVFITVGQVYCLM
jgi:hypothetical protein